MAVTEASPVVMEVTTGLVLELKFSSSLHDSINTEAASNAKPFIIIFFIAF